MKRHALSTRIWHWVNVLSFAILFMSGLNISNAHRYLYWGQAGFFPREAWLSVIRFPGWATIPNYYSLAAARDWHVLFAWIFSISLLLFMFAALINGHFRRDIVGRREHWRPSAFRADIRKHLRLDFKPAEGKYNLLQKAAYGVVIFILLPLMVLTGLTISPGMDAAWPFLVDLFGGRQSARSIHFIVAWALLAFFVLHFVLLLLNRPLTNLRDMISGGRLDETA
jgi:Ni/Fe-hydrogenase b-type cytochrome subunit